MVSHAFDPLALDSVAWGKTKALGFGDSDKYE